jgi:signal transduction histidine kinase
MADQDLSSPPPSAARLPLAAALRQISIFADLSDEQMGWLTSSGEEVLLSPGDTLVHSGDKADTLFVLLEGELRIRGDGGGDVPSFTVEAGEVTGLLPFSRMKNYRLSVRASEPARVLRLHKSFFPEMFNRVPELLPRLVALMADRIREVSRAEQQREKLAALGKLSAGLAHELNNPASAARRAAEALGESMCELRRINNTLDSDALSPEDRAVLASLEESLLEQSLSAPALDALEQSDREEELAAWLERNAVPDASKLAPGLVEAGVDCAALTTLSARFQGGVLSHVLARVVSSAGAHRLTREIESSTGRISELVRAIKEYSYMDQAPEQELDVHRGLDSTLTMFKFRLKHGVEVKREYDASLPHIVAHGSELNQVWTNLIDNAIAAMDGKGVLTVRTARELEGIRVEIIDSGAGIPEEVKPHIFDPFFTTKGVGEGTGIGLDTVYRIVRAHHGEVSFDSAPGRTSFKVVLPIKPR